MKDWDAISRKIYDILAFITGLAVILFLVSVSYILVR